MGREVAGFVEYELLIERVDHLSITVLVPESTSPEVMMAEQEATLQLADNMAKKVVSREWHLIDVRETPPPVVEGPA